MSEIEGENPNKDPNSNIIIILFLIILGLVIDSIWGDYISIICERMDNKIMGTIALVLVGLFIYQFIVTLSKKGKHNFRLVPLTILFFIFLNILFNL